jgi:exopolysaccharide biosynthesis protein
VNQKKASWTGISEAIQAFPAIMSEGHTFPYMRYGGRGFDVQAVDRRTAICLTWDDQLLVLTTDTVTNGLSFMELATLLGGLGCRDAMGLDGGTSTGLYLSVEGTERRIRNLKPVPVVLGIVPR